MYYFFVNDELLPVPPPKMTVRVKNKNKTIDLINEGEVNIVKAQGLQEVSFEALLPNSWYPFARYDGTTGNIINALIGAKKSIAYAQSFVEGFETLKIKRNPFRLVIVRMSPKFEFLGDTNLLVTLEDYSVDEDAGDGFDFRVPMKFKQYRPYGTKELIIKTNANGNKVATVPKARATTKEIPRAYKTAIAMSALEVCRIVAGGQLDWRKVAANNQILNPNSVPAGTVIDFWK